MPYNRFKDNDSLHPDAKFIFTKRKNAETWLNSVKLRTPVISGNEAILRNRERMYGARSVIPELYLQRYYRREVDVMEYFVEKYGEEWRTKLLVVCWEIGEGWPELCEFLGVDIPDVEFPHKNRSKK
jgi:hypothetical protein